MNILLLQHIAILVARVILAVVLLYFGLPKIKNLKQNAVNFVGMGFKPGWLWGSIAAIVEVVGGIFIGLGFMSWIFGALVFIQMVVITIWKLSKSGKQFKDWSYDLVLAGMALFVVAFGSGLISIDYVIFASIV